MRIDRLGLLGSPAGVLRAIGAAAAQSDLPPPAALTGEWFGSRAVIAPTLSAQPCAESACWSANTPPGADFYAPSRYPEGAVGGGWFGYLSYPDGAGARVPEAAGGWTDCVLRCDSDGAWWYESLTGATIPDWLRAALQSAARPRPWHIDWTPPDRTAHRTGVLACLAAIEAGEVYQACVCTQFTGLLTGSSLDFFADAVAATGPARGAYLAGAWGAVASLSPELFLRRAGATLASSPIKGTLPAHADPAALRASVKDVAENIMIVDLVRNDLSRVAAVGSVRVPELLAVKPAPGVWHLTGGSHHTMVVEQENGLVLFDVPLNPQRAEAILEGLCARTPTAAANYLELANLQVDDGDRARAEQALRRGLRGSADHNGILRMVGNQGLVRWNMAFTEVLPCVASKWAVNANSTEFTFTLRPGMSTNVTVAVN